MNNFTVYTDEQLVEAAHDAATSKRYLEALREVQAQVAALEKDAARYRFLKEATWHIEKIAGAPKPDAQWSVSFYSSYGAAFNEDDEDRAIDVAMKGGA